MAIFFPAATFQKAFAVSNILGIDKKFTKDEL
jgi:hypothetical protein